MRRLIVLLVLAIAVPALAADDEKEDAGGFSPEAKKLFSDGKREYNLGNLDKAIEIFKAAIAADPKLPGPYRELGLTYRALNRCAEALPMYEKYLELRPESRFTDRVRREIDLCRAKTGQAPLPPRTNGATTETPHEVEAQAFLHVAANMIGGEATDEASVRVDGILRGPTPLTVPVTSGTHKIHLERPGFESADAVVEIKPGERREIELTLNKLPDRPPVVYDEPKIEATKHGSYRKPAWALLGVATALGLAGAGLGLYESKLHGDAENADHATTTRALIDALRDRAGNYAIGAYLGLSLGGAALAASVILFILDPARRETHAHQKYVVAPFGGPGAGGLAASVNF